MRALTIRQPWAGAIFALGKDVENRTWGTAWRGPLAIHAAKAPLKQSDIEALAHVLGKPFVWVLDLLANEREAFGVYGAVLGVAMMSGVVTEDDSHWAQDGAQHWLLRNVRMLEHPVYCVGKQGLWTLEERHEELVTAQLLEAS